MKMKEKDVMKVLEHFKTSSLEIGISKELIDEILKNKIVFLKEELKNAKIWQNSKKEFFYFISDEKTVNTIIPIFY